MVYHKENSHKLIDACIVLHSSSPLEHNIMPFHIHDHLIHFDLPFQDFIDDLHPAGHRIGPDSHDHYNVWVDCRNVPCLDHRNV